MRKQFNWTGVTYSIKENNDIKAQYNNVACFSEICSNKSKNIDKESINISDIECLLTKQYIPFYLNYINEMLQLNGIITNNSFEFKRFNCNYKTLLVLTLIRILFGKLIPNEETLSIGKNHKLFFENLEKGECIFEDKLERFCYFYKEICNNPKTYWHEGHYWKPWLTLIKNSKDFINVDNIINVNSFFYKT